MRPRDGGTAEIRRGFIYQRGRTSARRLRVEHGAENFSRRRRRRIALNKRKRWDFKKAIGQSFHAGIHRKQQACGWSHQALLEAVLA